MQNRLVSKNFDYAKDKTMNCRAEILTLSTRNFSIISYLIVRYSTFITDILCFSISLFILL